MNDQESGQTMRARGWKFFVRRGARGTIVNWHVVDARETSQGSGRSRKAALANALNKARSLTHAGEGFGLAGEVAGPQMVRT